MMNFLGTLGGGFRTLLTGLGVTLRQMVRRPVTLTYPHKKPELSAAYRSLIKLIRLEDLDSHDPSRRISRMRFP